MIVKGVYDFYLMFVNDAMTYNFQQNKKIEKPLHEQMMI